MNTESRNPLTIRGVTKQFRTGWREAKEVLTSVDLDVPRGAIVGLLGVNGSGKTTLLKMLVGLLRADAGEVRVFGDDPWTMRPISSIRVGCGHAESPLACTRRNSGVVMRTTAWLIVCVLALHGTPSVSAADEAAPTWQYRPDLLRPFWVGDVVEGESVLFIRDEGKETARASVLFPIRDVLAVRTSAGDVTYKEGRDYVVEPGSREIVLPAGSRIVSTAQADLRRPGGTQKYALTHRDGNGEILFGAVLEYAAMQTCITYRHEPETWKSAFPAFDPERLPRSVDRLAKRQPLSIVTLGDSISAGANASAMYDEAPFQPAYPELVRRGLAERCGGEVRMTNLSVGGMDSAWGLTQIDKVLAAEPDLVILAFGMNDSAGRSASSYKENIASTMRAIRQKVPACEFILVATMLGNRDWTLLKQELFVEYRQALLELAGPGVAVADLTTIWEGFLERKHDWDQTGNGVNHPNDFGHRVYAQVITTLLCDPAAAP